MTVLSAREILSDSLSYSIGQWFTPGYSHPFMNINITVVSEKAKPIPLRWVNEVEIDELGEEMGDIMGEGPVLSWSTEERRQRLQVALKRLDLTEESLTSRKLSALSRVELATEKKRVKQELKKYDTDFRKQFKFLPNHAQKEVMRPLYVYYRRLKQHLLQAEQGGKAAIVDQDSDDEDARQTIGSADKDSAGPKDKRGSMEGQIAQLEARANTLHQEKGMVRTKLKEFQENFVIQHHRKIRFHKDILPIEREYRMYKTIKEEISKVESQLRTLRGSLC